jgi:uncharacterized protein (TIGR01777 family)
MNILIAGGTGFIGKALVPFLQKQHDVTILTRQKPQNKNQLQWIDLKNLDGFDIVINLCGQNIGDKSWSFNQKNQIVESRIEPTKKLASLCAMSAHKPRFLNASAIGVYGLQETLENTLPNPFVESTVIDFDHPSDFLSLVARKWELSAKQAVDHGCDVTWMRFGVVLDTSGGALKKLYPSFRCGLGAKLGNGYQPFCWISLHDLVRAIGFVIDKKISGVVNCVSPNTVMQFQFANALANALKKPRILKLPDAFIVFLFGQMGLELLLRGQYVLPNRLLEHGFDFELDTIEKNFKDLFLKNKTLLNKGIGKNQCCADE